MITKLNVWLTRPDGESLKAGELAVKDPDDRGALQGQFRFSQEYLESSKAFSLDPIHLPLSAGLFDADRPHSGVHGVFEDSLPDETWAANIEREMRMGRYQDIRPVKKITLSEAMERIFMPVKISQMQENRMIHNAVQLIFRGGSILVYGQ